MTTQTMQTKTEFKFDCPTCGQHILAATAWIGREIHCPSCETAIKVIPPASKAKKSTQARPAKSAPKPKATGRIIRVSLPPREPRW
jgi:DNA-directed RNA polymerase subunit M/transcription elongation factor TFIIS